MLVNPESMNDEEEADNADAEGNLDITIVGEDEGGGRMMIARSR